MTSTNAPTIHMLRQHAGIAGQFSIIAAVQYPDEPQRSVEFIGSTYGGPVVMRSVVGAAHTETFVTDPGRFGEFGPEWVRRFFTASR